MKSYTPKSKIACPYCKKKQEHPANYYIPSFSFAPYEESCIHCEQNFLVRRNNDGFILVDSNWTFDICKEN